MLRRNPSGLEETTVTRDIPGEVFSAMFGWIEERLIHLSVD